MRQSGTVNSSLALRPSARGCAKRRWWGSEGLRPQIAAEFGNADLTAKAFQHDADLLFGRMVPTGISTDVPDCLLRTVRYALACLSHRRSSLGYDEPKILSYAISPFCPTSADGLQANTLGHWLRASAESRGLPGWPAASRRRRLTLRNAQHEPIVAGGQRAPQSGCVETPQQRVGITRDWRDPHYSPPTLRKDATTRAAQENISFQLGIGAQVSSIFRDASAEMLSCMTSVCSPGSRVNWSAAKGCTLCFWSCEPAPAISSVEASPTSGHVKDGLRRDQRSIRAAPAVPPRLESTGSSAMTNPQSLLVTILLNGRPPASKKPAVPPKNLQRGAVPARLSPSLRGSFSNVRTSLFDQQAIRSRARPGDIAVDNTDPVFLTIAPKKQRAADNIAPLALKGYLVLSASRERQHQEKWRELMSGDRAAFRLPKHPGWSDCFATLGSRAAYFPCRAQPRWLLCHIWPRPAP